MKKIIDFASGYIAGLMLALFAVVLAYLGGKSQSSPTELGTFLLMMAGLAIGSVISIVCFCVIFSKMNSWQRIGIVAFIATAPFAIHFSQ